MWEHLTLAFTTHDLIRKTLALAYILESWLNGSVSSVLTQLFPAGYSMIREPRWGIGGRVAEHFESDLVYNKSPFQGRKKKKIIQVYPFSARMPVKMQKPWWSADLQEHLAKDLLSELTELQSTFHKIVMLKDFWAQAEFTFGIFSTMAVKPRQEYSRKLSQLGGSLTLPERL